MNLLISDIFFSEGDDGDDNSLIADREVDHLTNGVHNGEKIDSQSHISDSTCTIDIDRDNEDKTKLDEGKIMSLAWHKNKQYYVSSCLF